jgi:hypothetical protein
MTHLAAAEPAPHAAQTVLTTSLKRAADEAPVRNRFFLIYFARFMCTQVPKAKKQVGL